MLKYFAAKSWYWGPYLKNIVETWTERRGSQQVTRRCGLNDGCWTAHSDQGSISPNPMQKRRLDSSAQKTCDVWCTVTIPMVNIDNEQKNEMGKKNKGATSDLTA
jgi:hypothetical protein